MILLDTDHFSVFQFADDPRAGALRTRLAAAGDRDIATTIITFEEEMRGWLGRIHGERDPLRQVNAYRRLLELADAFRVWRIVPFDDRAAREFAGLRRQRVRIGAQDLKIASIAITQRALLLSANLGDFRQLLRRAVDFSQAPAQKLSDGGRLLRRWQRHPLSSQERASASPAAK